MRVLITGGSSGLGQSIVETLSKDQENFVFFTYNLSAVNAEKISKGKENVRAIKCDFTDNKELNGFIKKIQSLEIDVLVNNFYSWPKNPILPGTFLNEHFHKINSQLFIEEFKRNIIPTILITQEAIKFFRSQKQGKILTTLTSFLNSPKIGSSIYISNKNYLKSLCEVWAVENKKYNITSHYFSPSFMITGHTSKMDNRLIDQILDSKDSKKNMTVDQVSKTISNFLKANDDNESNEIIL